MRILSAEQIRAADQYIIARFAIQGIITCTAIELVVAAATVQHVASAKRLKDVVAVVLTIEILAIFSASDNNRGGKSRHIECRTIKQTYRFYLIVFPIEPIYEP